MPRAACRPTRRRRWNGWARGRGWSRLGRATSRSRTAQDLALAAAISARSAWQGDRHENRHRASTCTPSAPGDSRDAGRRAHCRTTAASIAHSDGDVVLHALCDALLGRRRARRHRPALPRRRPAAGAAPTASGFVRARAGDAARAQAWRSSTPISRCSPRRRGSARTARQSARSIAAAARGGRRVRQRQGHDHREAGLPRPRRGHRRAGRRAAACHGLRPEHEPRGAGGSWRSRRRAPGASRWPAACCAPAPEDFVVEEDLGFAPDGDGSHLLLEVAQAQRQYRLGGAGAGAGAGLSGARRRLRRTQGPARGRASSGFRCPPRRARSPRRAACSSAEFAVLEAHPHSRKLPRGALAGNRFTVRIRGSRRVPARALRQRCELIAAARRAELLRAAALRARRRQPARAARPAARSCRARGRRTASCCRRRAACIFNAVLGERVRQGSWEPLLPGDVANLDGRGSVFAVPESDRAICPRGWRSCDFIPPARCGERVSSMTRRQVLELEQRVAARACAAGLRCHDRRGHAPGAAQPATEGA